MASHDEITRSQTAPDIEIGLSEVLRRHVTRHLPAKTVSQRTLSFEHKRPRIVRECAAEAIGVFFYVFCGLASVANFFVNLESKVGVSGFSSFLQIGLAFALGIAFAIIVAAPTSGGHFNPAITICFALWNGFPWKKVPHYILSQIFGSMLAALLIMGMYWEQISAFKAATLAAHEPMVSGLGPAAILTAFPGPTQKNLGFLFFIEFFVDSCIAMIIWAATDPANPFISPQTAPFVIGLAYATMIWGFAPITISTNLARDFGCRIVAAMFYGPEAFTYRNYSWIAILVNIPATIFGTTVYEIFLRDSLAKINSGHAHYREGEKGLQRYLTETGIINSSGANSSGSNSEYVEEIVKTA